MALKAQGVFESSPPRPTEKLTMIAGMGLSGMVTPGYFQANLNGDIWVGMLKKSSATAESWSTGHFRSLILSSDLSREEGKSLKKRE